MVRLARREHDTHALTRFWLAVCFLMFRISSFLCCVTFEFRHSSPLVVSYEENRCEKKYVMGQEKRNGTAPASFSSDPRTHIIVACAHRGGIDHDEDHSSRGNQEVFIHTQWSLPYARHICLRTRRRYVTSLNPRRFICLRIFDKILPSHR